MHSFPHLVDILEIRTWPAQAEVLLHCLFRPTSRWHIQHIKVEGKLSFIKCQPKWDYTQLCLGTDVSGIGGETKQPLCNMRLYFFNGLNGGFREKNSFTAKQNGRNSNILPSSQSSVNNIRTSSSYMVTSKSVFVCCSYTFLLFLLKCLSNGKVGFQSQVLVLENLA